MVGDFYTILLHCISLFSGTVGEYNEEYLNKGICVSGDNLKKYITRKTLGSKQAKLASSGEREKVRLSIFWKTKNGGGENKPRHLLISKSWPSKNPFAGDV